MSWVDDSLFLILGLGFSYRISKFETIGQGTHQNLQLECALELRVRDVRLGKPQARRADETLVPARNRKLGFRV